jgi:lipid A 3-O-deacylase
MSFRRFIVAALCLALPAAISAQTARQDAARRLTLRLDNDAFNFWLAPYERSDDEYTSGARLVYENGWTPWWQSRVWPKAERCDRATTGCFTPTAWVAQEIFNPARDSRQRQIASSRPNAGWLYFTEEVRLMHERSVESASLTLGVTGPPALGADFQKFAHARAPRLNRRIDWSSQIQFEPGINARYEYERMPLAREVGNATIQLLPSASVSAGNVLTEATGGLRARFGWGIEEPWLAPVRNDRPEFAIVAGIKVRAIARDLFLDGNTFRDSPRVKHESLVREEQVGASLRYKWARLGYDVHWSTPTYIRGPFHIWSSMVGGVVFTP